MLDLFRRLFEHSDSADDRLLAAARALPDADLDTPFDMGPGSLRRTLLHIHAGHDVWLRRWTAGASGRPAEIPWPDESLRTPIADIEPAARATRARRDAFLAALSPADLQRPQAYRDSRGSLFRAPLADMILQGILHPHYHRAQAANMLRRLGVTPPECDFMTWARQPL